MERQGGGASKMVGEAGDGHSVCVWLCVNARYVEALESCGDVARSFRAGPRQVV